MNFSSLNSNKSLSKLILFFSLSLSLIIANRWLVLQSENYSIGRVFQLYVSYSDYGFFRRGFLGTILNYLGLTELFSNDYTLPLIMSSFFIILLGITLYSVSQKAKLNNIETFWVMFSPALLFHLAYSGMGSFDLLFVMIFSLSIFFNKSIALDLLIITIGILMHEIFLFFTPAILFMRYQQGILNRTQSIVIFISSILLTIIVSKQVISYPIDYYDSILSSKMPMAFLNGNIGHTELFSSTQSNLSIGLRTIKTMFTGGNFLYWILPTIYTLATPLIILNNFRDNIDKMLFLAACYSPIFILLIASDYYRWVSLSCSISIILIISLKHQLKLSLNKNIIYLLIPFSIFIAFGGADISWPFPLWQNLLQR